MLFLAFFLALTFLKLFRHRFGAHPRATRVIVRQDGCLTCTMGDFTIVPYTKSIGGSVDGT